MRETSGELNQTFDARFTSAASAAAAYCAIKRLISAPEASVATPQLNWSPSRKQLIIRRQVIGILLVPSIVILVSVSCESHCSRRWLPLPRESWFRALSDLNRASLHPQ